MKRLLQNIKKQLVEEDIFIIQGGYFEISRGIDSFSMVSYRDSIALSKVLKNWKKKNINNIVLVNNIERECSKNKNEVSINDQDDIIQYNIDLLNIEQIKLSYVKESHMKNIGTRKMKKLLKLHKNTKAYYLYKKHDNDSIKWFVNFANEKKHTLLLIDKKGSLIAKCPLIMGGFYYYLQKNYQINSKSKIVIIDLCKIDEREKVRNGAKVAYNLFEIKNISKIITIYYNMNNIMEAFDILTPTQEKTYHLDEI